MMTATTLQQTRDTGKDELTPIYGIELYRKYHEKQKQSIFENNIALK